MYKIRIEVTFNLLNNGLLRKPKDFFGLNLEKSLIEVIAYHVVEICGNKNISRITNIKDVSKGL